MLFKHSNLVYLYALLLCACQAKNVQTISIIPLCPSEIDNNFTVSISNSNANHVNILIVKNGEKSPIASIDLIGGSGQANIVGQPISTNSSGNKFIELFAEYSDGTSSDKFVYFCN